MGKISLGLSLPIEIIKELKWKDKQRVKVKKIRGGIVIRDFKNKK